MNMRTADYKRARKRRDTYAFLVGVGLGVYLVFFGHLFMRAFDFAIAWLGPTP